MCEMVVDNGIVIDAVENVVEALKNIGKHVQDPDVMKAFIINEKNTKFYIDDKLKSTMEPSVNSRYVWIDTGFRNSYDDPIFVSLRKVRGEYSGHITGTIYDLAGRIENEHRKNRRQIRSNVSAFQAKYRKKAEVRSIQSIEDEKEFYLQLSNGKMEETTSIGRMLTSLEVEFAPDGEENIPETCFNDVKKMESTEFPKEEDFSCDTLTINLLLEQMEKMQKRMDELVDIIEDNKKDKEMIQKLRQENNVYREKMRDIRLFNDEEEHSLNAKKVEKISNVMGPNAHELLDKHKKILVIGATSIGTNVLQGIAKNNFGFAKNDIDFVDDYTKVVNAAGRLQNSSKYCAVIFGKVPHKVSKLGCWSSIIEKFTSDGFGPYAIEAHNCAGELIINKESFRNALRDVCEYLEKSQVA